MTTDGDDIYEHMKDKYAKHHCPACMKLRDLDQFKVADMVTGRLAKRCIECNAKRKNNKVEDAKPKKWGHEQAFMGDYADEMH